MAEKAVWGTQGSDCASDARLARQKLLVVAEESGLSFDELLTLWSDDTTAQLAGAGAALAAGNLAEAARLVHGASGASGLCGVAALSEELRRVEALAIAGRRKEASAALEVATERFASLSGALHKGIQS